MFNQNPKKMKQYLITFAIAMVACVVVDYVLPLKYDESGDKLVRF